LHTGGAYWPSINIMRWCAFRRLPRDFAQQVAVLKLLRHPHTSLDKYSCRYKISKRQLGANMSHLHVIFRLLFP
jgi:hypothetical protein